MILHYLGTQLGVGNWRFCSSLGLNWELGIWESIVWKGLLGGHLGNQNHWAPPTACHAQAPRPIRPTTSAPRAPAEMPLRCIGNGGGWSFGELSFGLSAQVVPKSRILARKRASFGNQSILTRRNDKVSHLLHTKYSLNYEYVGTNPAFC